jgi:hypothetical protein
MKTKAIIALLIIVAQFTGCTRKSETGQTQTPAASVPKNDFASTNTLEAIEVTIAISIPPDGMRGEISDRLKTLIKKFDAEMVMGMISAGTEFRNLAGGEAVALKDEWSAPFNFTAAKIPPVKFRKGEVGIYKTEIFVKEGTEALVNEKAYVFTSNKWTALGESITSVRNSSEKFAASSQPLQPVPPTGQIKKLIIDACIADRESLQGYTGLVDIQSTTPDTSAKGKILVLANVAFSIPGTRMSLGYIDHFVLSQQTNGEWSVEIVKKN